MQRGNHAILQFQKPLLHLAPCFGGGNYIQQLDHFALTALHVGDVQHISEHHTGNALKALLQMKLHPEGEQSGITSVLSSTIHLMSVHTVSANLFTVFFFAFQYEQINHNFITILYQFKPLQIFIMAVCFYHTRLDSTLLLQPQQNHTVGMATPQCQLLK